MNWIKKILPLLLVAIGLTGCGQAQSKDAKSTTQLNYGSTKDIRDINPHLYSGEMAAQNMVFEGLTKNEDGKVKPALATKWTVSPDGLTYTFTLRKNVRFSDGTAFDAKVAKQNFDAILANKPRHAWLELVNEIDQVKVAGPDTLVLTLKHPYYPTLVELGLTRPFRFLSPKSFEHGGTKDGIKSPVGTGPYVLANHKRDQVATFKANAKYWGTKPKIKTVAWHVIPESQALLLALKKGSIDLIYGADGDQLNMDTYQQLDKSKTFATYMSQPVASRAILLNTKRLAAPVRQAISLAIDQKQIVDGVLDGTETKAATLLPKSAPYCDVAVPKLRHSVSEANQILTKAGYAQGEDGMRAKDGQPLVVTFSYNNQNEQEGAIAQVVQANLKAIGIKVKIAAEEKQAFLDRQKDGQFDLQYSLSWGTPYDPQSYLSSWRIPAHGDYQAQLGLAKKAWLDQQIGAALVAQTDQQRQAIYQEILQYVASQQVYVPISYSRTKAIAAKRVQGITFNDSQYEIPFEKMSLTDD